MNFPGPSAEEWINKVLEQEMFDDDQVEQAKQAALHADDPIGKKKQK